MNRRNHKKQKEASMHARSTLNSTGSWLRMFCVYLRLALHQTREEQEWEHDIDALCEKRWINSLCVVASFFSSFFVSLEILLFSVCCFSLFLSFYCCCYWWWWLAGWLKLFFTGDFVCWANKLSNVGLRSEWYAMILFLCMRHSTCFITYFWAYANAFILETNRQFSWITCSNALHRIWSNWIGLHCLVAT